MGKLREIEYKNDKGENVIEEGVEVEIPWVGKTALVWLRFLTHEEVNQIRKMSVVIRTTGRQVSSEIDTVKLSDSYLGKAIVKAPFDWKTGLGSVQSRVTTKVLVEYNEFADLTEEEKKNAPQDMD